MGSHTSSNMTQVSDKNCHTESNNMSSNLKVMSTNKVKISTKKDR